MNKLIFSLFVVILLTSILFVMNFKKPISNLSQDDIPKTVVKPYKPDLNYPDLVIEGIEKALKENKQPLIIFGANWCPDCIILHQITLIPQMAKFINENFELIYVDVGDYRDGSEPKNKQILLNYGIVELEGVPTIVVLSKDLKVLNKDSWTKWRNARERQPSEFYFYLNNFLS